MKKEGTDKVTEMVNKEVRSTSRGEKCLAKFTASNGNVYGSLTLDIRKAGDYSQPLPVAVRVCHAGQKVFLRLGKTYTMEEWLALCDYEKSGRRIQLTERNGMKNLMDRVELITNQLIAENNFSLRKLQDRFQGRRMMTVPSLRFGIHIFNLRPMKVRLDLLVAVRMCATVLSKI